MYEHVLQIFRSDDGFISMTEQCRGKRKLIFELIRMPFVNGKTTTIHTKKLNLREHARTPNLYM